MARLDGRVAIVTGGSRGIGAATARKLAADGARVVVNYARGAEAAEAVVQEIRTAGGEAMAVQADVSDRAQVARLVEDTVERYGWLDVLVNNAGVIDGAPLGNITDDHVERQFAVNVRGALYATQAAVPAFGDRGGRVVNVSSAAADAPPPGLAVYAATKAALEAITRSLAAELAPRQVTVNAVAPGVTVTDMFEAMRSPEFEARIVARTPLGRLGRPEDIAEVIAFLASEESGWVTGQVIAATGGLRL
jgi:3-oxoacyl-[acyl-carrier protein] reductase